MRKITSYFSPVNSTCKSENTPPVVSKTPTKLFQTPEKHHIAKTPSSRPRKQRRIVDSEDEDMTLPEMSSKFEAFMPGTPTPVNTPRSKASTPFQVAKARPICDWLSNPRDAFKRAPDHPDYDKSTLFIPPSAYTSMTPAQRQFWEFKSSSFDVVLCFKMGKFYELFDMDAEIGHKELDLSFMKGDRPHVGFPESAFEKYAEKLVHLGYKVGRIEQMETPQELKERNKSLPSTQKSKVVRREMVSFLSKGTLIDPDLLPGPEAQILASVSESESKIGICLLDSATGLFRMGDIEDSLSKSGLRTIFAQFRPQEMVFPKNLAKVYNAKLGDDLKGVILNPLDDLWTLDRLKNVLEEYPEVLSSINEYSGIAQSAFLGCLQYLNRMLLDKQVLTNARFVPLDPTNSPYRLLLDVSTLKNLEIFETTEGNTFGSLFAFMDQCVTGGGKRKLRDWVGRPLARLDDIHRRLDVVEKLGEDLEEVQVLRKEIGKCPDFDRLLSKLSCFRFARGILYENVYLKHFKVFWALFEGLFLAVKVTQQCLESRDVFADILGDVQVTSLMDILDGFKKGYELDRAKENGFIIPLQGEDEEYDSTCAKLTEAQEDLQNVLKSIQKQFNDSSIQFVHKTNERYQLEISEDTLHAYPDGTDALEHVSRRKGFQRFYTADLRKRVVHLEECENEQEKQLEASSQRFYSKFCSNFALFYQISNAISELDCFLNLCLISFCSSGNFVKPEFRSTEKPFLDLENARHPCLATLMPEFVPNDTALGTDSNPSQFALITGPNMGGKSTLLRQICLTVIMAQIGCFVPADKCALSPVDRIFTRVGAQDKILSGQSTFFVELEETSTILQHATERSLVILDELGRGTSTFDGTAIAFAVSQQLFNSIKCRTLFSTHYHVLAEEFEGSPKVSMFTMDYILGENGRVNFLYKFVHGVCSKSFGMNVARMAGIEVSQFKFIHS